MAFTSPAKWNHIGYPTTVYFNSLWVNWSGSIREQRTEASLRRRFPWLAFIYTIFQIDLIQMFEVKLCWLKEKQSNFAIRCGVPGHCGNLTRSKHCSQIEGIKTQSTVLKSGWLPAHKGLGFLWVDCSSSSPQEGITKNQMNSGIVALKFQFEWSHQANRLKAMEWRDFHWEGDFPQSAYYHGALEKRGDLEHDPMCIERLDLLTMYNCLTSLELKTLLTYELPDFHIVDELDTKAWSIS